MVQTDVVVIGAGASGLMCAITAGKRGKRVLIIDHSKQPGAKILMSGGGRCNFTNRQISAQNYISHNPHFCKSALKQYTQWDFIELLQNHNIQFEERGHGELFCCNSSREILDMLLKECAKAGVNFKMSCPIDRIERLESSNSSESEQLDKIEQVENREKRALVIHNQNHVECDKEDRFRIFTASEIYQCRSLVIATGGLSIPSSGSTPFGYRIAEQFGIKICSPRAGLVPFTLNPSDKAILAPLSGIAVDALVQIEQESSEKERSEKNRSRRDQSGKRSFRENILFTHRGVSGPAILQISSYWHPGETIKVNLLPDLDLFELLIRKQKEFQSRKVKSILSEMLPKRLITALIPERYCEMRLGDTPHKDLREISEKLQQWSIKPAGTEGYRTAEVTLGGVDCGYIVSKSMEARDVKGLFFTGEVLDVTGWLGGYNLQWAWSSGWCAGKAV